jgi:molybdopterin molybdotransferase
MVEETEETDGLVTFRTKVPVGANIRRRGEDAKKGAVLLKKKTVLGPVQIGLCSAVGKAEPRVHRHPDVAVLCTGEELRPLGLRLRTHERRDSNGVALFLALCAYGCTNVSFGFVSDDLESLSLKANQALAEYDVLVLTGGVSVGKYDLVPEVVGQIGAKVRFHGVAMKPGKPILYATLRGNRHIFGLPGNPVSAMTGFYEFVLPAIRRMSGVPAKECRPTMRLPLNRALRTEGERVKFVLGRLLWKNEGPSVRALKFHGSADLVAGALADGAIVVPAGNRELPAGSFVEFRPWGVQPW